MQNTLRFIAAASLMLCANALYAEPDDNSDAVQGHMHGKTGEMMFKNMDTNHDGVVSRAEFNVFNAKRFKELDANHDGKITQEEVAQRHKGMAQRGTNAAHGMPPEHPPVGGQARTGTTHLDERFNAADANHDGGLDRTEAANMPMLSMYYDEVDANKDGKVTREEYFNAMPLLHRAKNIPPSNQGQPL